jgi:hypothetical protein
VDPLDRKEYLAPLQERATRVPLVLKVIAESLVQLDPKDRLDFPE